MKLAFQSKYGEKGSIFPGGKLRISLPASKSEDFFGIQSCHLKKWSTLTRWKHVLKFAPHRQCFTFSFWKNKNLSTRRSFQALFAS